MSEHGRKLPRLLGMGCGGPAHHREGRAKHPGFIWPATVAALALAAAFCLQAADLAAESQPDPVEMVLVSGGPFIMGSLEGEADERPVRKLSLGAFFIDKYEVTHARYARFIAATGHKAPVDWPEGRFPAARSNHPVVNVTWADADAYARWCGKRLPTEAEWEKAARGTDGRAFPWGQDKGRAAIGADAQDSKHPEGRTFAVGSFPKDVSPYGAMDMGGNVWEWTGDWYEAYPGYGSTELEFGRKYKTIRGGGAIDYYGVPATGRCSDRTRMMPYGAYDALGFRCVKEAP